MAAKTDPVVAAAEHGSVRAHEKCPATLPVLLPNCYIRYTM
jgi:hypothetical protein